MNTTEEDSEEIAKLVVGAVLKVRQDRRLRYCGRLLRYFLATGHFLDMFGVASSLHRDLRGRGLDLAEVVGRQSDGGRSQVLVQAMQLRGTRDGDDPGLLGEQPGEGDLGWRRPLPARDAAEQVDQGLIRLQGLRREAGQRAAEVGAVEGRVHVDLAREEAPAQRAVGDEADAELFKGGYHFPLGLAPPE
jgi:hypothetical protein